MRSNPGQKVEVGCCNATRQDSLPIRLGELTLDYTVAAVRLLDVSF